MATHTSDPEAYQSFFHEAFRPDLFRILDALPIPPGGNVLDVPCGNGFYCGHLAKRLDPSGHLTAVDTDAACLYQTQHALNSTDADSVTVRGAVA